MPSVLQGEGGVRPGAPWYQNNDHASTDPRHQQQDKSSRQWNAVWPGVTVVAGPCVRMTTCNHEDLGGQWLRCCQAAL